MLSKHASTELKKVLTKSGSAVFIPGLGIRDIQLGFRSD